MYQYLSKLNYFKSNFVNEIHLQLRIQKLSADILLFCKQRICPKWPCYIGFEICTPIKLQIKFEFELVFVVFFFVECNNEKHLTCKATCPQKEKVAEKSIYCCQTTAAPCSEISLFSKYFQTDAPTTFDN